MESNGWIKLHRKILENPLSKKPQYAWLWITLLLIANHKEHKIMWNGEFIIIKEGQILTGRKELSLKTGIPESSIERILKVLESEHQIEQQKTTKFRLITVINWKEYQNKNSKADNKRTTSGQQADTNKNDNNEDNEEKNTCEPKDSRIPEVIKLFEEVNPSIGKYYGNTTQRSACERLLKKWSVEQIKAVVGILPELNATKYAKGKSITPLQLEENLGYIKSFIEQKKSNKRKVAII